MTYQKILDVSKRRGIVYPSFELYGGVSGFVDYGPTGVRIKKNIEDALRRIYVVEHGCLEVECPTLSPEDVWVASGHVKNFTDFTTECLKCGEPYRADHLLEEKLKKGVEGKTLPEIEAIIQDAGVSCPKCGGKLDKLYDYNLMFQTFVGPGKYKVTAYLRPETAQTTYIGFKRLWEVARKKLPFGVLQMGRSYRNEISPRQGMIRLREFNQAEIQFFMNPDKKEADLSGEMGDQTASILAKDDRELTSTFRKAYDEGIIPNSFIAYHLAVAMNFFTGIGISREKLRLRQHKDTERSFYSSDTWDVEFMSDSLGRIELVGIADRGDYDLSAHIKLSKQDLSVTEDGKKFVPHVIEVAYGIDRPFYCVLESCYSEDGERSYFRFPKAVSPYAAAVFPLVNKDGIYEKACEVYDSLTKNGSYSLMDVSGSIGKKYARADEIGVPCCITVDYDTLKDDTVTVRDRDTKKQERIQITDIISFLGGK
ncbi:MAG: glycine--tRNA ligase [Candidatus Altiarchaeota archaeon]